MVTTSTGNSYHLSLYIALIFMALFTIVPFILCDHGYELDQEQKYNGMTGNPLDGNNTRFHVEITLVGLNFILVKFFMMLFIVAIWCCLHPCLETYYDFLLPSPSFYISTFFFLQASWKTNSGLL